MTPLCVRLVTGNPVFFFEQQRDVNAESGA